MKKDKDTPITMLTVEEFMQIVAETPSLRSILTEIVKDVITGEEVTKALDDKYNEESLTVRGIHGIASIFGCSLPTAQKLKKTVIKDAVVQQGRVIITNVRKARQLFEEYTAKNGQFAALPNTKTEKKKF